MQVPKYSRHSGLRRAGGYLKGSAWPGVITPNFLSVSRCQPDPHSPANHDVVAASTGAH